MKNIKLRLKQRCKIGKDLKNILSISDPIGGLFSKSKLFSKFPFFHEKGNKRYMAKKEIVRVLFLTALNSTSNCKIILSTYYDFLKIVKFKNSRIKKNLPTSDKPFLLACSKRLFFYPNQTI